MLLIRLRNSAHTWPAGLAGGTLGRPAGLLVFVGSDGRDEVEEPPDSRNDLLREFGAQLWRARSNVTLMFGSCEHLGRVRTSSLVTPATSARRHWRYDRPPTSAPPNLRGAPYSFRRRCGANEGQRTPDRVHSSPIAPSQAGHLRPLSVGQMWGRSGPGGPQPAGASPPAAAKALVTAIL